VLRCAKRCEAHLDEGMGYDTQACPSPLLLNLVKYLVVGCEAREKKFEHFEKLKMAEEL
jgi:hypothetical protein